MVQAVLDHPTPIIYTDLGAWSAQRGLKGQYSVAAFEKFPLWLFPISIFIAVLI